MLRRLDPESPLSVGNGEFAFTVDVTGLQTFAEAYEQTIPLGTLSQWGWHTAPNPEAWTIDRFRFKEFDSHGREGRLRRHPGRAHARDQVAARESAPAAPRPDRLRADARRRPHGRARRSHRHRADARSLERRASPAASASTGEPVEVETICHPALDARGRARGRRRCSATGRHRDRPRVPLRHRAGRPRPTGRSPEAHTDRAHAAGPGRGALRPPARRRHVPRVGPLVARRDAGRDRAAHVRARRRRAARASFALTVGVRAGAAGGRRLPAFDDASRAARAHWNRFWSHRRRDRPVGQRRSALARARAAHRAVAVPDGHPVRRPLPAAGDRA